MRFLVLVLLAACTKAPSPAAFDAGPTITLPLEPALARVAARLREQRTGECTWTETTIAEEYGEDGKPKAKETAVFAVTPKDGKPYRKRIELKKDLGELPTRMRPPSDDELSEDDLAKRLKLRLPFQPDEQASYQFRFKSIEGQRATLTFMPKESSLERGIGIGVVDLETGQVLSIESAPSKPPAFLQDMKMTMQFAPSPCGDQPVRTTFKADGAILGMQVHIGVISTMAGFALADAVKP